MIQKIVVVIVEVWCWSGRLDRADKMLDRRLSALGGVVLREIVPKINPRSRFAVETGKLDLVGCPL